MKGKNRENSREGKMRQWKGMNEIYKDIGKTETDKEGRIT